MFNFQEELETYCYADVALLAASMTKFENNFFDKTQVMLFSETVTAAGAALLTFQRRHLKRDMMCLDMNSPGTSIKQSKVAKRYLGYREQLEQLEIIREFKVFYRIYQVFSNIFVFRFQTQLIESMGILLLVQSILKD